MSLVMKLLCKIFPHRDIVTDGDLYLRRFFITPRSWPKRVFLHYIARSDKDRHLHDHPFDFTTLLLTGAYIEDLPSGKTRTSTAGDIRRNKAEHTHKLRIWKPMWTILLVSQARRQWGFHTEKGWVHWRDYLKLGTEVEDSAEDVIPWRKQA